LTTVGRWYGSEIGITMPNIFSKGKYIFFILKDKNPNEFWNQQAPPKKSFEEPTGLDELRRKQKEKQRPLTSFTDDVFEPVSPKKKKSF
jgi:hypothetical protein